ncbi:hypothetical protein CRE_14697 [Caenorhabditis remanei]|uniref:SPK domain-containing protein n=1 Tax=Caenorhabditis remanei TaxID=31234 RepID=E3M9M7_CAERE|nr:hypothetical protein CRE_14697 [Caenorhabditis remanei]
MEYYEHSKFGIDWAPYQTMFPGESKSGTINRMTEIVIFLNPHWKGLVAEEKWKGNWDVYRDHFSQSLAHKIEKLNFIDFKLRALLLFVSSVRVTEAFKKQLEEYRCICRYDEHKQNAWIQSDFNEICVEGEHRKVAKNGKKKGKKNGKNGKIRKNEEQEDDDDDDPNILDVDGTSNAMFLQKIRHYGGARFDGVGTRGMRQFGATWNDMKNLGRDKKISLVTLAEMMISLLEEWKRELEL